MQTAQIPAEIRIKTGKAESGRLRRQGRIPASVYGKEYTPRSIHVSEIDVEKVFKTKLGINTLIELNVTGAESLKVLIKEVQGHAITRRLHHVDFCVVREGQRVNVWVPVRLDGKCAGVTQGGLLEQLARQVQLSCPVGQIPEEVVVDVTNLVIGKNVHLSEVKLPTGIELEAGYNPALVTVIDPKKLEAIELAKAAEAAAAVAAQAATQPVAAAAASGAAPGTAPGATPAAGAAPAAAGDKKSDKKAEKK